MASSPGRLIPAHAGKTADSIRSISPVGAHPRSRGENAISRPSIISRCGSSPLTRGKLQWLDSQKWSVGLIPAHAGKTPSTIRTAAPRTAHPRSRGENQTRALPRRWCWGSSPLTRGKRASDRRKRRSLRLIPAHAGKTLRRVSDVDTTAAHPRSRGENAGSLDELHLRAGSSPLTRGKHLAGLPVGLFQRLIPAHAGKTTQVPKSQPVNSAHPRSRGENQGPASGVDHDSGSSPLTRGKHFLTCAFTAQIDQILETLELAASSGSYSIWVACATDAPQDQVRSIGLVLPSSRGAS